MNNATITCLHLSILHPGSKPTELSKLGQQVEKGTPIANDVFASVTTRSLYPFLGWVTKLQYNIWFLYVFTT